MPNHLYDRLFAPHAGSDRTFLVLPDGARISYADFLGLTARYAHALKGLGLETGDRIALQLAKSPEMLALVAASIQAGVVFLPLNTAYTAAEVHYFVENSGARVLVCDPGDADKLTAVAAACEAQLVTLGSDGQGSFADLAERQPAVFETVDRGADDLAAFLYTSGTTGRSKGAMLSHDNLLSNAEVLADYWRFTADDVLLHALPIFHTHGLFVATNVILLTGAAMIFVPKFDAAEMIRLMPQATTMMGVPTFYTRLLDDPRFDRDLVAGMRLFVSGSAPLLAETHRQFEDRTGHRILERYGMTETNMNTSNPYDGDRRAGTVGVPLPGVEVKVCDAEGAELPAGEIGTLEVRGPNVFQGYWQMPEKTAKELRADGFFITGDLAFMDADGYVTIVGRGKDLIISGGFNIYPKELELLLDDQPGVLESAVIGVPHPDFGETPLGLIVATPGAAPDLDTIMEDLRARLARFKHPRELLMIDALPRNTMGKVQKAALRDAYRDRFSA
ncbi:malonate--CoA ligase [Mesobacterium pallidum]|uniref:malonate--CoA ligase n=1 Tax=Mesobacterium pallidum TaxID=2872037 RepID=UPI001EE343DC|nr:malonyl-CoA synthase [Mesobacterium pallidum]